MERIAVTIRIDGAQADAIDRIVGDLKSHGLENVQVHGRLQIVNGDADPEALDALRSVGGVASVRKDSIYKAI